MDEPTSARVNPKEIEMADEAAQWLLRLDEDSGAACRKEFSAWLRRSPQHMQEFLLLSATAASARKIDPQRRIDVDALLQEDRSNVVTLPGRKVTGSGAVPRSRWISAGRGRFVAIAAATAIALIGFTWLIRTASGDRYQTAIGELRSFQMEDGSLLHLGARSRVQVRYTQQARDIVLLEGEALFVVARDAVRPFRVTAGETLIQALGTSFNVSRQHDETTVSVVEGRVRVAPAQIPTVSTTPARTAFLEAGQEAHVLADGQIVKQAQADIAANLAWQQRRLVFKRERLDTIATAFNRYNHVTLRVEGPAAERRVTGTFNADDPDAFIGFLQEDPTLEIERDDRQRLIRVR